jgi:deazaflavin-dependent oxidoreductase (nitroreductase family)
MVLPDLHALNRESLVQLTVRGRKSGKPYTVKIWFAVGNGKIYVTSARGMTANWIKNLRKNPEARIQIGNVAFNGAAVWRDDPGVRSDIFPLFFRKYFLARIFKWIGWYATDFAFEITPTET